MKANLRRRLTQTSLLTALLVLPTVAQAQFNFTTNNGAITITGYTGTNNAITIPPIINGLPVTGITLGAFQGSALSDITIPESVASLPSWFYGVEAFYGCASLTAINVDAANRAYSSVDGVLFDKNQTVLLQCPLAKLGHYTIPASVTNINNYAFGNTSLSDITIPSSVIYIASDAFASCLNLTKVFFKGNCPSTGMDIFQGTVATVYYLPGTAGWGWNFGLLPTALWLPQMQTGDAGLGGQSNQFGFNINWASGQTVVVEACSNLTNPVWSPVATNTLAGDSSYFNDSESSNYPARFYRLHSP